MGARVAPCYANLFMRAFEDHHIYGNAEYKSKIILYKRYIDKLLFVWGGREEKAKILKKNDGIKFTLKFGPVTIDFLDLVIMQKDGKYITSTNFKTVDK